MALDWHGRDRDKILDQENVDMASQEKIKSFVDGFWDGEILPAIQDYIRVPNVSPHFDPEWDKNGHMEKALELAKSWVEKHKPEGSGAARRASARSEWGRSDTESALFK